MGLVFGRNKGNLEMSSKAVFLDRDGTLNVDKDYLYKINDFVWIAGVKDGLTFLQNEGYKLIIITNQSGIARGYYTEKDFLKLNAWMLKDLKDSGIHVDHVYYCPHLPNAKVLKYRKDCDCRKPRLGLFKQAVNDFDIDLNQSFAIGDKIRDCAICAQSGCHGFLIGKNEEPKIIDGVLKHKYFNIEYLPDLYSCAMEIKRRS